ncbi:MAG: hypothetical protein V4674_03160 [Patescibacteria group bacterium]
MEATLRQGMKVLQMLLDKGYSLDRLQELLESGYLGDLLDGDRAFLSRSAFRSALGWEWRAFLCETVRVTYRKEMVGDLARLLKTMLERTCWMIEDDPSGICWSNFDQRPAKADSDVPVVLLGQGNVSGSASMDKLFGSIDKKQYRYATAPEMLTFLVDYKNRIKDLRKDRDLLIVAPGSTSFCHVLVLERDFAHRDYRYMLWWKPITDAELIASVRVAVVPLK